MSGPQIGDPAPRFVLPDQDGNPVGLDDLLALGPVVLYFYPKDETPGCTREACRFRDEHEAFRGLDASVVGVSADSTASHRSFADARGLPFALLSDADDAVRGMYGIRRSFLGLLRGRETFLIDGHGIVRARIRSQLGIERHVAETLRALRALPPESRP